MRLHRQPALCETHVVPGLHPTRAVYGGRFVGGDRPEIGIELKQRRATFENAALEYGIAIHENRDIVLAHAVTAHRAKRQADRDALARLRLPDNDHLGLNVPHPRAESLDHPLIGFVAGGENDTRGYSRLA